MHVESVGEMFVVDQSLPPAFVRQRQHPGGIPTVPALGLRARAARPSTGPRPREIGAGAATFDGECGGPAECVGLVRRCCGTGSVVGFCFGISDCGASDTLPATPPP